MKRVKLKVRYCGQAGVFPPGMEVALPDNEAKFFVKAGLAEQVRSRRAGAKKDGGEAPGGEGKEK